MNGGCQAATARYVVGLLVVFVLAACGSAQPRDTSDSCAIFKEKSRWYRDADASYQRWGVPVHVQMAILYQESAFVDNARPPRTRLLWVIPWTRPSTAFGYAQATDGTWDWYRSSSGNRGGDRDDFGDVTDFLGWYGSQSYQRLGVSLDDAYRQYLAYHEGHAGYARRSFRNKPWLDAVARKVERRARDYELQLASCAGELIRGPWYWPF
jgi:hypothetical protein